MTFFRHRLRLRRLCYMLRYYDADPAAVADIDAACPTDC